MKQTAVEWLAEKYDYAYWMVKRDEISPGLAEEWKKHYLEQAKEMEKEQMCDFFREGYMWCNSPSLRIENGEIVTSTIKYGEFYYNKTFKNSEQ